MAKGDYINLNRRIRHHWLWQEPKKLQWWLDMLMLANYKDNEIVTKNERIIIKRGSFLTSTDKLSKRWQVARMTVQRFLNALEKDDMISKHRATSNLQSGTIITIKNYDDYQY